MCTYGTAQMQLHTRTRVLACPHACANMCVVMSNGTHMSLTYRSHLATVHTCYIKGSILTCYTKGCSHACVTRVDTYTYDARVSPTCSRQSLIEG